MIEGRIQVQFDRLDFKVGLLTSVGLSNYYMPVKVRDIHVIVMIYLSDVGIRWKESDRLRPIIYS